MKNKMRIIGKFILNKFFLFTTVTFSTLLPAYSNSLETLPPTQQDQTAGIFSYSDKCLSAIQKLRASHDGLTEKGNRYKLYAFKISRKEWAYIMVDSSGYHPLSQRQGQEAQTSTESMMQLLCMLIRSQAYTAKMKEEEVSGLLLSCYYKIKPKDRKMFRLVRRIKDDN